MGGSGAQTSEVPVERWVQPSGQDIIPLKMAPRPWPTTSSSSALGQNPQASQGVPEPPVMGEAVHGVSGV